MNESTIKETLSFAVGLFNFMQQRALFAERVITEHAVDFSEIEMRDKTASELFSEVKVTRGKDIKFTKITCTEETKYKAAKSFEIKLPNEIKADLSKDKAMAEEETEFSTGGKGGKVPEMTSAEEEIPNEGAAEFFEAELTSKQSSEMSEGSFEMSDTEGSDDEVVEFSEGATTDDNATDFTANFGKVIFFKWYQTRHLLRKVLREEFPRFASSKVAVQEYAYKFASLILEDNIFDVFDGVLYLSAFIFELVYFCYERGIHDFLLYGPVCWSKVFVRYFAKKFFQAGGWKELKNKKLYIALFFDQIMHTINELETKQTAAVQGLST